MVRQLPGGGRFWPASATEAPLLLPLFFFATIIKCQKNIYVIEIWCFRQATGRPSASSMQIYAHKRATEPYMHSIEQKTNY